MPYRLMLIMIGLWLNTVAIAGGSADLGLPPLRITTFGEQGTIERAVEAKLRTAYGHLGFKLTLAALPGERALDESNRGVADGELMRVEGLSQAYPHLIQVKVPVTQIKMVAFSRDPAIRLAHGWQSLQNHSFAYERGTKVIEAKTATFTTGVPATDLQNSFKNLMLGRVDLVVVNQVLGQETLKKMGLEQQVIMLSPPLESVNLYHYVNKKHADLVPLLESELKKLSD